MKITHNKVGQNLNTTDSAKSSKADKSGAAKATGDVLAELKSPSAKDPSASSVTLSPRAQEMKKIKETAMAAPDINEEKVARLQKLIDEGNYKVDAKEIADKMVDDHLAWS